LVLGSRFPRKQVFRKQKISVWLAFCPETTYKYCCKCYPTHKAVLLLIREVKYVSKFLNGQALCVTSTLSGCTEQENEKEAQVLIRQISVSITIMYSPQQWTICG
jgi:hypothetical protein